MFTITPYFGAYTRGSETTFDFWTEYPNQIKVVVFTE